MLTYIANQGGSSSAVPTTNSRWLKGCIATCGPYRRSRGESLQRNPAIPACSNPADCQPSTHPSRRADYPAPASSRKPHTDRTCCPTTARSARRSPTRRRSPSPWSHSGRTDGTAVRPSHVASAGRQLPRCCPDGTRRVPDRPGQGDLSLGGERGEFVDAGHGQVPVHCGDALNARIVPYHAGMQWTNKNAPGNIQGRNSLFFSRSPRRTRDPRASPEALTPACS